MAVQYNSKDNTWSTWLDIFKKEIPQASEESINAFEKLAKAQAKGYDPTINGRMEKWIHQNKLADESLVKFLTDANYGTKDLANYQEYLKKTSQGMTTFEKATKKAGTVLKSFGAALGSMAINWLIGESISLVIELYDHLVTTLDESKEKFNEQKSQLEDYQYNNNTSKDIIDTELILCNIENTNEVSALSREVLLGEPKYLRPVRTHFGIKYGENPTYTIGFVKKDETSFTLDEKRKIMRWLTKNNSPSKLELFSDYWDENIYWKGLFIEVKEERCRGTVILIATFQPDSQFAYKDFSIEATDVTNENPITLFCDSDIEDFGYLYPTIIITSKTEGQTTITVTNEADIVDGKVMSFDMIGNEQLEVSIDCQHYIIKDDAGNVIKIKDFFITDDDTDVYWFRLVANKDNIIYTSKPCDIIIKGTKILKAGVPSEFNT